MNAKEVLFIGKQIDNGEFVEGLLAINYTCGNKPYYAIQIVDESNYYSYGHGMGENYGYEPKYEEVEQDSLNEFTGKLDIKGKRVYGSHICRYGQNFERMGKVEWRNFGWYIGDLSIADTELEIISF